MSDFDITVAGHICLDVIPQLLAGTTAENVFCPGTLRTVGPATLSTGGVVSNTGLSLFQMGFRVQMAGMVGNDPLGAIILEIIRKKDPALTSGMIVSPGQNTSYTIVLNPPGTDRAFLHCPGVNDAFTAADLNTQQIAAGRILHFGYPPLMRGIYSDGGAGLAEKFRQVQTLGLLTSLDMAYPTEPVPELSCELQAASCEKDQSDHRERFEASRAAARAGSPATGSGRVDWTAWLKTVLPTVDVFLPSFDEILLMTDKPRYDQLCEKCVNPAAASSLEEIRAVSVQLTDWGAKIVVMKLGDQGLYVHASDDLSALQTRAKWTEFDWSSCRGIDLYSPCYDVPVVGTTGSGDATVAGFLASLIKGLSPEEALNAAVATGACNVQAADAVSGIPDWETILEKSRRWGKKEGIGSRE